MEQLRETGKARRRKRNGVGIHAREVPSNFPAVVAPMFEGLA